MDISLLFFSFVLSITLTGMVRWFAVKNNIIDTPNERSSHSIPTPRGGGLAIVISFYSILIILFIQQSIPLPIFIGLLGLLCVAVIGFIDDHNHISARYRLVVHFASAVWICFWLGIIPWQWANNSLILTLILWGISVLYSVWLLNLYNFMDGIDGIATVEAICVLLSASLLLFVSTSNLLALSLMMPLVMALLGFLFWNWPPANIFMGDVGSAFLGILIASFSLITANNGSLDFFIWIILLAVFIGDATYTLMIRFFQSKKVYEAHCSHTYQILSQRFGHKKVTLGVLAINSFWLLPLAWLGHQCPEFLIVCVMLAYLPLIALAIKMRAGTETLLDAH
ncbi:MAG: glycosyltransferase family 4 protein [Gammaproteobacteria bacterium]|nr:glycosyltransferase family 4 protein [Gammaproteobacteria bacterium]